LTGLSFVFSPTVAIARDERWGRTYESFGEAPALQHLLVGPLVTGLQQPQPSGRRLVACAKHFIGDGATRWGTGMALVGADTAESGGVPRLGIDRGDVSLELEQLKRVHGAGFVAAVRAGVQAVTVSFHSVGGLKMHAHQELLEGYLKADVRAGGLGFRGLVISDWNGVDEIRASGSNDLARYRAQIVEAVNAGVDLIMTAEKRPGDTRFRFERAVAFIAEAARSGEIPEARLNDAVMRILRVKHFAGLWSPGKEKAKGKATATSPGVAKAAPGVGAHRNLARTAVRKSLVLLKNRDAALPVSLERHRVVYVAGKNADEFGSQFGGWTAGWQGRAGNGSKTPGAMTDLPINVGDDKQGLFRYGDGLRYTR
jgi:beta-glucosidase